MARQVVAYAGGPLAGGARSGPCRLLGVRGVRRPGGPGAWERDEVELALDRAAKERGFRVFPVLLPGLEPFDPNSLPPFLRTRTWVDFRLGVESERALEDLIRAVKGIPFGPDVAIEPREDVCPYRGLQVFDERSCGVLLRPRRRYSAPARAAEGGPLPGGRRRVGERQVVARARRPCALAAQRRGCQAASSGGSSSSVPAGGRWRRSPHSCCDSQASGGCSTPSTSSRSDRGPFISRRRSRSPGSRPERRVAFVVDQFEEVFTLCRDEDERSALIDNLLYAATVPDGQATVLLTLRADFYPRLRAATRARPARAGAAAACSPDRRGWAPPGGRAASVPRRPRDRVRSCRYDPRRRHGSARRRCPCSSTHCSRLWRRRRGGMLTLEGYRESGGVRGALSERAEEIYASLGADKQTLARRDCCCGLQNPARERKTHAAGRPSKSWSARPASAARWRR